MVWLRLLSPNLARLISSLNDYCISSNDNNIFVHMYIGGNFSNDEAKISINSNYLTHGEVEFDITVYKPFKLALRIPDWCNEFEINKNTRLLTATLMLILRKAQACQLNSTLNRSWLNAQT